MGESKKFTCASHAILLQNPLQKILHPPYFYISRWLCDYCKLLWHCGVTQSTIIILVAKAVHLRYHFSIACQGGAVPQLVGVCSSEASTYWLPILLVYKCLYLIVGLWLATTTYRVRIKELRDSKLIVACVIGITVVSLVLTLITFLLPTLPNATYGVIGSFVMVLLTSVLFLLFGTRVCEG